MSADADRAWVIVVGATGFMGRLVCRALRRRGVRFAIAGRDARKLSLLSESLGGVEQHVVDTRSRESVARALDGRLLVSSCTGPFVEVGEPVLRAAAELGVHYVDVSDEQAFARRGLDQYDAIARAGKACVVPAMGFATAPADWAATLLADRLGGAIDELDVLYVVRAPDGRPRATRGALRSALATLGRAEGLEQVDGALAPVLDGADVRTFDTRTAGTITAVSYAGAEAVLVPRHLAVRELRTYRATTPFAARALQAARRLAPIAARAGRDAFERLLAYASEGPDIGARAATTFEIVLRARRGGAHAEAHVTGADPCAVTAAIQAHAAEAAIAGYVSASGVVAPGAAYPALAAFANLSELLAVHVEGDQLAPVRKLRSIRPQGYLRSGNPADGRYGWQTVVA